MDAYGQIPDETLGNGLRTIRGVEPRTGMLESLQSGRRPTDRPTEPRVHLGQGRQFHGPPRPQPVADEIFEYDDLHRLTRVTLNGVETLGLAYGVNGNILSRSGAGSYTYDPIKLHAVSSISQTGGGGQSFTYEANGNMTKRNGAELLWFADNRPKRIKESDERH